MLLSGEVSLGVIHDSGIYRYDGQNQPTDFVAPSEGVLSLEQVLTITPGSKVKELANAYVELHAAPGRAEARSRKPCGTRRPTRR